ncbi:hypothetical protein MTAT_26050 [Moorella thermoacetica]|uniref:Antitoxin SocA-like Panacea domain-containing protein n=1 Tax=Neomoorella thermoacetica TaxID=1525 RepID=A0A1D7X870_NEOTH|nr:type II toxin-antitoxin system antitoxin SocA domain-containing protein [Moorella thermoacetica]AOQ23092.1 hypothetical protein Maut_00629 [Moorella thermoacetica]OIQ59790.1 hypothetical protein MOTE_10460 [Moorella thermoacetica]TYL08941.1 hypothetical protein MTAT_26050 [Moorella thermoacetica]
MATIYLFGVKGGGWKMGKITVFDVAKYFLTRVDRGAGSVMTHLKLQKLCYYAQAWHLVFTGKPLFEEQFEAWTHGPVCPALWHEYKGCGYQPIPKPDNFDPSTIFTKEQLEILDEVWNAYGQFDAKYLEELTHQEEPWRKARGSCLPGEACNNIISLKLMKEYYSQLLEDE